LSRPLVLVYKIKHFLNIYSYLSMYQRKAWRKIGRKRSIHAKSIFNTTDSFALIC